MGNCSHVISESHRFWWFPEWSLHVLINPICFTPKTNVLSVIPGSVQCGSPFLRQIHLFNLPVVLAYTKKNTSAVSDQISKRPAGEATAWFHGRVRLCSGRRPKARYLNKTVEHAGHGSNNGMARRLCSRGCSKLAVRWSNIGVAIWVGVRWSLRSNKILRNLFVFATGVP